MLRSPTGEEDNKISRHLPVTEEQELPGGSHPMPNRGDAAALRCGWLRGASRLFYLLFFLLVVSIFSLFYLCLSFRLSFYLCFSCRLSLLSFLSILFVLFLSSFVFSSLNVLYLLLSSLHLSSLFYPHFYLFVSSLYFSSRFSSLFFLSFLLRFTCLFF